MQATKALRNTANNANSIYKILITGLLIYELVVFRWFKKYPQQ